MRMDTRNRCMNWQRMMSALFSHRLCFRHGLCLVEFECVYLVQPAGIEETRPVLLDQMGFGNCVLVRNSTVNMEVIGDCGCFFDKKRLEDSLVEVMQELVKHTEKVDGYRAKVTSRIENYYNWERVTSFYEDLFVRLKESHTAISYDEFIPSQHFNCADFPFRMAERTGQS